MSIQAMAWVLDHSEATGTDRLVLLAIANHLNGGNESEGWSLGMERIAREARVHPKTARRSVLRLEAEGVIRVQRTLGGARLTNRYWLTCFEEPPRDGEGSTPEQGYPQPPRSVQKPPRSVQKPPRSVPEPSHGWERNRNNQNNQNNRGVESESVPGKPTRPPADLLRRLKEQVS